LYIIIYRFRTVLGVIPLCVMTEGAEGGWRWLVVVVVEEEVVVEVEQEEKQEVKVDEEEEPPTVSTAASTSWRYSGCCCAPIYVKCCYVISPHSTAALLQNSCRLSSAWPCWLAAAV
jgi:hypothetical protein